MVAAKKTFEKIKEVKDVWINKLRKRKRDEKRFPFGFVLALSVITVLLLITVSNSVTLNEYTIETSRIEKEIKELKTELKAQELLLEKRINLVEFDEYASYSLGMIKGEYKEVTGTSRGEDTIESYDGNYSEGGWFTTVIKAISEKFTESWNNLLR